MEDNRRGQFKRPCDWLTIDEEFAAAKRFWEWQTGLAAYSRQRMVEMVVGVGFPAEGAERMADEVLAQLVVFGFKHGSARAKGQGRQATCSKRCLDAMYEKLPDRTINLKEPT